jgi:hypothetical protein
MGQDGNGKNGVLKRWRLVQRSCEEEIVFGGRHGAGHQRNERGIGKV